MAGVQLSIIVVNYRSEQYLKKCLASIYNNFKSTNQEIIIVNNDEREVLDNLSVQFPGIKIINHQKNIGFGAGNNFGVQQASGEYLLFLNPDTEILSDSIKEIIRKFESSLEVAVIGPRLVTEKGETQWWCAGKENTIWSIVKNNLGAIDSKKTWESEKEVFVDWVSGGAMFVRADIFKKIGGFDENFFMYFEDNDLCKRIRENGQKILYLPECGIRHFGGKSARNKMKQKKQFYLSEIKYFWKHRRKKNV